MAVSSSTVRRHGNCEQADLYGETRLIARSDRIPGTFRQLFNSSMAPAWRITQPYCVALAPQVNSPEPLWYVGCKVLSGEEKLCKLLGRRSSSHHPFNSSAECIT